VVTKCNQLKMQAEETEDPELATERAMETYPKKGYTKEWINQRLKSIEVRKELTDERYGRVTIGHFYFGLTKSG